MIPEIGALSLNLALAVSILLAVVPLYGSFVNDERCMRLASSASFALWALVAVSFVILSHAFATDDFSVKYVATNSNSLLPIQYKFSAVWAAMKVHYCFGYLSLRLGHGQSPYFLKLCHYSSNHAY